MNIASVLLILFGLYHAVVGLAASVSVNITRKIAFRLYKLQLPEKLDPLYEYNLKPLGFYALLVAAICFWGCYLPAPYQGHLLLFFGGLLVLRSGGRFFYRELFQKAFGTPWSRSRLNVGFNLILAGLFFYLGLK